MSIPLVAGVMVAGVLAAAGWKVWAMPPSERKEVAVDFAAAYWEALTGIWLNTVSLFTVWVDVFGCELRPITVRAGPARIPVEVRLTSSKLDPRALRALVYFWRYSQDQRALVLRQHLKHYSLGAPPGPIDVTGVIIFPAQADAPLPMPLPFRIRLDVGEATVALTHARASADARTKDPNCSHPATPLPLKSAALPEVLAPLLGRTVCPSLIPKQD